MFLRASVLLSKEQSGAVDMANEYNWRVFLLSIIIIRRGQQRLTPLGWLTTWWRLSKSSQATKIGKIKSPMHESWWKSKVLYHEMASILPYKA